MHAQNEVREAQEAQRSAEAAKREAENNVQAIKGQSKVRPGVPERLLSVSLLVSSIYSPGQAASLIEHLSRRLTFGCCPMSTWGGGIRGHLPWHQMHYESWKYENTCKVRTTALSPPERCYTAAASRLRLALPVRHLDKLSKLVKTWPLQMFRQTLAFLLTSWC